MEDYHQKLDRLKARKKEFLRAMPKEYRQLLKLHASAMKRLRRIPFYILGLFCVLLLGYIVISMLFAYPNRWIYNGIATAVLFLLGFVHLLFLRRSQKRNAAAFSTTIADFADAYEQLDRSIAEVKREARQQRKDATKKTAKNET